MQCQEVEPVLSAPAPVQSALAHSVQELLDRYSAGIACTVATMNAEGAGMLKLAVVDRFGWQQLAAVSGSDPVASLVLRLAMAAMQAREDGCVHALVRCAGCGSPLQDGRFQLAIAHADCPAPSDGLTLTICSTCGPTREATTAVGARALAPMFNGCRVLPPIHTEAGHA